MQNLLFSRFGKLVLGRSQIAGLLGITENALRLQELKARSRGQRLLPEPLARTADGHVWSLPQIARWLAGDGGAAEAVEAPQMTRGRGRGRPRIEDVAKAGSSGGRS